MSSSWWRVAAQSRSPCLDDAAPHLPLDGSLNPADAWETLQAIPQVHFVGVKDRNVGVEVINAYLARFPPQHRPAMQVINGFDHTCCWAEQWSDTFYAVATIISSTRGGIGN